jgi:Bacteriophage head to tail connecting protein
VSGSQYAHSPATVAALADSRVLQAVSLTLLEAGQKAVDPPMVAVQEAIRSSVDLFAGGVTYVDAEYDERLGEVLRPVTRDIRGLEFGVEQAREIREMIAEAFFLNKIVMPAPGEDMTAYEVQRRMEEYVRQALPLFEPMEMEYNGQICDRVFNIILGMNGFGDPQNMPEALSGAEVKFEFESPLQSANRRIKVQAFNEASVLLKAAAELDMSVADNVNVNEALRDALDGLEVPAEWLNTLEHVEEIRAGRAEEQAKQAQMQELGQAGMLAEQLGKGGKEIGNAATAMQESGLAEAVGLA